MFINNQRCFVALSYRNLKLLEFLEKLKFKQGFYVLNQRIRGQRFLFNNIYALGRFDFQKVILTL